MQLEIDSKDLFDGLGVIDSLYNGYSGYRGTGTSALKREIGVDCVLSANDAESLSLEIFSNGLYVKKVVKAKVEKQGKLVVNSAIFMGLPRNKKVTIEYDAESDSKRFSFKSGKTKGALDVSQDQQLDPKPIFDVEISHQLNSKFIREAYSAVAFRPRSDEKLSGTVNPNLTCRLIIKDNVIEMSSNDDFFGAHYRNKNLPVSFKPLDIAFNRNFFEPLLASVGDHFEIGIDDKAFKVSSKGLEVVHPFISIEVQDLLEAIEGIKSEPVVANIIFQAGSALEAIGDTLCITNAVTASDKELDGRVNLTLKDKSNKAQAIVTTSFGESDSEFDLVECFVADKELEVGFSGKMVGQFLQMIGNVPVCMAFWPKIFLMESKDAEINYIIPTLTK